MEKGAIQPRKPIAYGVVRFVGQAEDCTKYI